MTAFNSNTDMQDKTMAKLRDIEQQRSDQNVTWDLAVPHIVPSILNS